MKFLKRFAEPSTHAGMAGMAQVLKAFAPQWGVVFDCATALLAALAVAMPEKASASA